MPFVRVAREWNGMDITARKNRAAGRAIISVGVHVATDTKRITHRVSGTLARSIHVAEAGYPDGDLDEAQAQNPSGDLLLSHMPEEATSVGGSVHVVEVGSWLPYACVEWVGRGHPGITQGLEMNRGAMSDRIVMQAFREEGLA